MMGAQPTSTLPQKRPRSGPGTWKRHYCDPAVSPKHAKGDPSPRTAPERAPRAVQLPLHTIGKIAEILGQHARHREPPEVIADVLGHLPMSNCERSTVSIVQNRNGTGWCNDLTYAEAAELSACDRRTAIQRFARTEGYGCLHVEPREYPYGGSAPNNIRTRVPSWVYKQIDDYLAVSTVPRRPDESTAPVIAPARSDMLGNTSPAASTTTEPAAAAAPVLTAGAAPSASNPAATSDGAAPTPAETAPPPPAPALSPEDAAIDRRLVEIHAFTSQRFQVASVRGLNARVYEEKGRVHGVPNLENAEILAALDEYINKQRPKLARKTKYRERPPRREGVEHGIHAFLWYKRARLDGLTAKPHAPAERKRRAPAATPPRASAAVDLTSALAPVQLGVVFRGDTTVVRSVIEGSLAASMGIQPDDTIVRIDEHAVRAPDQLRQVLSSIVPGQYRVELVRAYDPVTTTMTIEPRGPPPA